MITIGIPSYDHIKTECVISLLGFAVTTKLDIRYFLNQSLYIDYNRNQLVDVALQNDSSHLLFIDSDIQFPLDGLDRLLAHDKDIVGGYYNTRRGNCPVRVKGKCTCPVSSDSSFGTAPTSHAAGCMDGKLVTPEPLPETLFPCHVLPTGFMLIKLECLKQLSKPYFATLTHEKGTIGEDVFFCKKSTDAGLELYCDPSFKLGHVGKHIY